MDVTFEKTTGDGYVTESTRLCDVPPTIALNVLAANVGGGEMTDEQVRTLLDALREEMR